MGIDRATAELGGRSPEISTLLCHCEIANVITVTPALRSRVLREIR
jgi:hypothetical protein